MYCRMRWALCLGLSCCLVFAVVARGQEAKEKAVPAVKNEKPQPATEETAEKETDATSGARAVFDEKLEAWKTVIKEMRKLKLEFQSAPESEHPKYEEQWNALIEKGRAMLPPLADAALAAYEEAGGADPQLERFLLKMITDAVKSDNFESAYDLATQLIAHGCSDRRLYDAAGVAAYCTNQYAEAEKYLKLAKDGGVLSELGGEVMPQISIQKELWVKEAAIRKEEEEADDLPRVKLTTSKGEIVLELFENQAPDTVGNFVHLVEKKYYDGLTFHRVLEHFMAQGGDPKGDGTGGPGWQIYDEVNREDYRRHFRGSLSMAKTAEPNTGGSQFFLTFKPTPTLDGKHTCFGRIISGMDVLARLQRMDPEMPDPEVEPDRIITAEVLRKREHAYVPKKVE